MAEDLNRLVSKHLETKKLFNESNEKLPVIEASKMKFFSFLFLFIHWHRSHRTKYELLKFFSHRKNLIFHRSYIKYENQHEELFVSSSWSTLKDSEFFSQISMHFELWNEINSLRKILEKKKKIFLGLHVENRKWPLNNWKITLRSNQILLLFFKKKINELKK